MFLKLNKNKIKPISYLIYKKLVLFSRNKIFYTDLKVPDTLDGRFDLIIFHLFFVHTVLFRKGALEQKIYDEVEESKNTFLKFKWPTIDVSRKSVEETAASVIKIYEISRKNA